MKLTIFCLLIVACNAIIVKDTKRNVKVVSRCRQTKPASKIPKPKPNQKSCQYEVIEIIDEPDFCQSNFKKEPLQYAEMVEDKSSALVSDDPNDGSISNDSSYDGVDLTIYGSDDESDEGRYNCNDSNGELTGTGNDSNSVVPVSDASLFNNESDDDNCRTIADHDRDINLVQNVGTSVDENSQNIEQNNGSDNESNKSVNSNNENNISSNSNDESDNNCNYDSSDGSDNISNDGSDNSLSDGTDNSLNNRSSDGADNGSNGNDDGFEFTGKVRAKGRVTIEAKFNGGCDSNTGTDYTIAYKRNNNDYNSKSQGNGCSSQKTPYNSANSPYLYLPPVSIPHFFNQIWNTNYGTGASGSGRDGAYENGAIGKGNNGYGFNCFGSTGSGSIGYPLLGYDCNINGLYGYPLLPGTSGYSGGCGSNLNAVNVYGNDNCCSCETMPKMGAHGLVTIAGKF